MRVKMVAAILARPAQLEDGKRATNTFSSDDDDDVEPGEESDPAVKSVATPNFDEACVVNSDDASLSSSESISLEAVPITRPDTIITGKAQDSSSDDDTDAEDTATSASGFSTLRNPVFEALPRKIDSSVKGTDLGKQMVISVQKEDVLDNDECGDDGNYAKDVDERSRLMIAALAAGIPSDDNFSDDSEDGAIKDDRSRLMAAAQAASIPSDDSFSDDSEDGAIKDDRSRLMAAAQAASIPSDDSFSDDSEDGAIKDDRSRLMAAAQAASIPSGDSFSDDSEDGAIKDDRSRLMAAAQAASIPSGDSFSDDSEDGAIKDDRSRLMAAAQAASIPSDDRFSDDSERTRLMAAAQAASISSDDSFRDNIEDGSVHPSSISEEVSTRVERTDARFLQDSEDLGSDDSASSYLTVASSDDESQINRKVLSDTTGISVTDYSPKMSSRYSAEAGEDGPDGDSNGWEQSDHSSGDDVEKTNKEAGKKVCSSRSFSGISTRFNWSDVKTKIFYSFRALKASAGSSSDGSRTILVKNLAREVTDDRLHNVFQESGTILDIQIIRDAQSGLSSAYVEFESGNAARKALRKSGKKLEGRVILCDIAYENSKGNRSVPDSGHGARERSELFESGSASTSSLVLDTQSALKLYDPDLREADAKFLSRFSGPFSSYNNIQSSVGYPKSITSPLRLTRGHYLDGSEALVLPWPDLDDDSLILGKTEAELEQSFSGPYFDAVSMSGNLSRQSSLATHRKIPGPRKLHNQKFMRFFWPWKSLRWQGLQVAKESSTRKTPTARRPKAIGTKHRTSHESVKRLKSMHSKLKTSQESVKLFC